MDPWNIFDFVIVVGSIVDIIIGESTVSSTRKLKSQKAERVALAPPSFFFYTF